MKALHPMYMFHTEKMMQLRFPFTNFIRNFQYVACGNLGLMKIAKISALGTLHVFHVSSTDCSQIKHELNRFFNVFSTFHAKKFFLLPTSETRSSMFFENAIHGKVPEVTDPEDQLNEEPYLCSTVLEHDLFTDSPEVESRNDLDHITLKSVSDTGSDNIETFDYYDYECEQIEEIAPERILPVPLIRGEKGVFDVEDLVTVLEDENAIDIQVIDIKPEFRFVDHMVIVSGRSYRHLNAIADTIHWIYKRRKGPRDNSLLVEGAKDKDWIAMDMGNIAVHIFSPEAREYYDLETLWRLGPDHDNSQHYEHDCELNLSAADLFWLETGWKDDANVISPDVDTEKIQGADTALSHDVTEGNVQS